MKVITNIIYKWEVYINMETSTANNKSTFSTLKSLSPMIRPFRFRIVIICACALILSILRTLDPLLRQRLIDDGVLRGSMKDVIIYAALIFSLFILNQLLEITQFLNYTYINKLLRFRLFHNAFRHLLKLPVSFFKDSNSTKIISNIEYDVINIAKISDPVFIISIVQGLCMIGGVIGLAVINWVLALIVLCVIPVKILINRFFTQKRAKAFETAMKINSEFSEWFGETVQGIGTIKLWGMFSRKIREFSELRRKIIRNEYSIDGTERENDTASGTINELLTGVLYILGAIFIFQGQLTIGGLFSIISFSSVVINSISFLTRIKFYFTPIIPSLKRYQEFMGIKEEERGYLEVPESPPRIKFDNVSLNYDGITDALRDVSFELYAGEKVAIVGANGSGKSSIIQLILCLYEPTVGTITYCGVDIRDIDIVQYRSIISQVEQKVFLFNASVKDNIDLSGKASDKKLMEVAKLVGISSFIDDLPDGLGTSVGVDGTKLSGGERQKLAALRALIKPHKVLILDEAASNFDLASERMINEVFLQISSSKLLIMVTHRTDILYKMDKILVMDNGRLVGCGKFTELMNTCPVFIKLMQQTGDYCMHRAEAAL
jgi:ATP-binding cassette subfamily B protein